VIITFTTVPAFRDIDYERELIIDMDTSDYVSAGVRSQRDGNGAIYSAAYCSKKHTTAECTYDKCQEELMVIIQALEEW